jgi:hypothetical protein
MRRARYTNGGADTLARALVAAHRPRCICFSAVQLCIEPDVALAYARPTQVNAWSLDRLGGRFTPPVWNPELCEQTSDWTRIPLMTNTLYKRSVVAFAISAPVALVALTSLADPGRVAADGYFLMLNVSLALAYVAAVFAFKECPILIESLYIEEPGARIVVPIRWQAIASVAVGATAGIAYSLASRKFAPFTTNWVKWTVFPIAVGALSGFGYGLLLALSRSLVKAVTASSVRPYHPDGSGGLAPAGAALVLQTFPLALGVSFLAFTLRPGVAAHDVRGAALVGLVLGSAAFLCVFLPPVVAIRSVLFEARRELEASRERLTRAAWKKAIDVLGDASAPKDVLEKQQIAVSTILSMASSWPRLRVFPFDTKAVLVATVPFVVQLASSFAPGRASDESSHASSAKAALRRPSPQFREESAVRKEVSSRAPALQRRLRESGGGRSGLTQR